MVKYSPYREYTIYVNYAVHCKYKHPNRVYTKQNVTSYNCTIIAGGKGIYILAEGIYALARIYAKAIYTCTHIAASSWPRDSLSWVLTQLLITLVSCNGTYKLFAIASYAACKVCKTIASSQSLHLVLFSMC